MNSETEFFTDADFFDGPHDFFAGKEGAEKMQANRFVENMPERQYHSDPDGILRLSNSVGGLLLDESPQHAWRAHPLLSNTRRPEWANDDERSKSLDFGTVVHQMLLGGDTGIEIVQAKYPDDDKDASRRGKLVDDFRTKAAQTERDRISAQGKIPLLQKEVARFERAADAVRERLRELSLPLTGKSELTALWCAEGIPCKGRLDHMLEDETLITALDIKTIHNANPRKLAQAIVDRNYHMQAAAYIEAVEHIRPEMAGRVRFVDVFIELSWPYYVVPVEIRGSMLELGQRKWRRAKRNWVECLNEGHWPDYAGGGVLVLEPKHWAILDEEERAAG